MIEQPMFSPRRTSSVLFTLFLTLEEQCLAFGTEGRRNCCYGRENSVLRSLTRTPSIARQWIGDLDYGSALFSTQFGINRKQEQCLAPVDRQLTSKTTSGTDLHTDLLTIMF
jgi:hypothetical protein